MNGAHWELHFRHDSLQGISLDSVGWKREDQTSRLSGVLQEVQGCKPWHPFLPSTIRQAEIVEDSAAVTAFGKLDKSEGVWPR